VDAFQTALAKALRAAARSRGPTQTTPSKIAWIFVHADQLTDEVGPIAAWAASSASREGSHGVPQPGAKHIAARQQAATQLGLILIESDEWLRRRPYHRQKLATILLNQRSFALESAQRGLFVRYEPTMLSIGDALRRCAAEISPNAPILMMEAAEREVRAELAPLVAEGRLRIVPNELWLTEPADFAASSESADGELAGDEPAGSRVVRMDRFYRVVRQRTGILMERGKPVGGRYSFDGENRERWDGTPEAPRPPRFRRTPLRDEVEHEILTRFSAHPGKLDLGAIPATRSEVDRFWRWAVESCLPSFGPYEDAMSVQSRGLFHTRITPILNIGRLRPRRVLDDALAAEIPIASKEGFVRQILGWREFVRHVHRETDGFRLLVEPNGAGSIEKPGDGGFERWSGTPWKSASPPAGVDGGATPNALDATTPLPPAWWGRQSGLACLDRVVADVWAEGWSHHITRLMILSNIATLLGVSPRELTDWFWVAYADAYDWVVEPNVLGMGTYGVGDLMTTKPYVSGSAYIRSMSDYCQECVFDPEVDCPITNLYWDFLRRNDAALADNQRMRLPLASARKRSAEAASRDRQVFVHVRDVLVRGERLTAQGVRQVAGLPPVGSAGTTASPPKRSPAAPRTSSLFP
jgi:deoxyribodipyrimidine photolyase-related protein